MNADEQSDRYWVGFNVVRGIGPVRLRALIDYFGDVERAWYASYQELRSAGLDRRSLENLLAARSALDLDREWERIAAAGAHVLTWNSSGYPPLLREIPDPPPVLYVKGTLAEEDAWAVAVVGTRRASVYGREVTRQLTTALARSGITIVSGLARGIDGEAHRAALGAGGRTIAVLGCGIDHIYPPEHRKLAREIVAHGALVSDYPLGTKPEGRNFPPRNRLIAALTLGVVVVQAPARSGALITASCALEQGRDVFAVPGKAAGATSAGTHRLIKDGARLVDTAEDIVEELGLEIARSALKGAPETRAAERLDGTAKMIYDMLSDEPVHIDYIVAESNLPLPEIAKELHELEIKKLVREIPGKNFIHTP